MLLKNKKKQFVVLALMLPALAVLQLLFFYLIAMNTGLPGRRGGPQDAFRHTYACAVVSKYLSPRIVTWVTKLSESNANSQHDQMDRHNNAIGIQIGLHSKNIYKAVWSRIKNGDVDSKKPGQITWLPQNMWTHGL